MKRLSTGYSLLLDAVIFAYLLYRYRFGVDHGGIFDSMIEVLIFAYPIWILLRLLVRRNSRRAAHADNVVGMCSPKGAFVGCVLARTLEAFLLPFRSTVFCTSAALHASPFRG